MSLGPEGRYATVAALAADVEHWLADEPVAAYREPAAARARRWAKRHRTLVSAAAVLLCAAVVGLSVGAGLLQRARAETEGQRKAAVIAQRKAEAINRFLIDDLLRQADPVNNPVGDKLTVRELLDKSAARLDGQTNLADQPEVEAALRAVVGHAYEYLDVNDQAERHYRRAWDLRAARLGTRHPEALAVRNRLACVLAMRGELGEAEALARGSLATCAAVLGENDPETAEAANNLAEVRMRQGRLVEAIALRRQASRIAHAGRDRDDNKSLEFDNNLAVALVLAGETDEAVPLLESVAARRRRINPLHPELATTLGNLGAALVARGRFADAEPVLSEAVALHTKVRGPNGAGTLGARNTLCYALEGQQKWADAEKGYRAVLNDRRKVEGQQGPLGTQRTLAYLARLHAKQRQWPDAARRLAALLLSLRPDPGRDAKALSEALAAALEGTAAPAEAGPLLRECGEALQAPRTSAGDWFTTEVASRYGEYLRRQGKYEEAKPVLEKAAADVRKAVGVPAWGLAAARRRVADLYEAWQKPAEAAKWR
jgi:tetratricopeptide (TPR) repeat protein